MSTQIIDHVKTLTLQEKVTLMELLFQDIKEETLKVNQEDKKREEAAHMLLADYQ